MPALQDSTFVGRQQKLACPERALDKALAGNGQVVLISGEAAIGKTRLCEEFARATEVRNAEVVWSGWSEDSGEPAYWAWAEALRRLFDLLGPALPDPIATHDLAEIARLSTRLASQLRVEPATGHFDPKTARFALFDGVAAMREAAPETPLVTVLEDAHWAIHRGAPRWSGAA